MHFTELLSHMLTEFVLRYVAEDRQVAAAEDISTIMAFGLRTSEEAMHSAFCEALSEQVPEIRRCVIDELFHPSSN